MADPLPDIIERHLDVVFCGINPAMSAAEAGHHFVRRSNRFWRAIHLAGFTPEEIRPENDRTILQYRCGLTAVVARPTVRADQLSAQEFAAAAARFERKITRYAPRFVAFLGKAAYSALSNRREIAWDLSRRLSAAQRCGCCPTPAGEACRSVSIGWSAPMLNSIALHASPSPGQRNPRTRSATASAAVSMAKWPASRTWISALGTSRR